ncbi:MAG: hypothetical protein V4569_08260 [Pseudomonadota bacterium]
MPSTVYSFDVFDTVLTRVYAVPDDVHLHVAEIATARGLTPAPGPVVHARRHAETLAWRRAGHSRAVQIETVYCIVGELLGWPDAQGTQLMQAEIELELSGVRPVPDMAAELRSRRLEGARVCFVSDMHLRGTHVRRMLEACGLMQAHDRLFVSSDHGMSKRSGGRLYRHAARELGVRPWQLRHCGDDWRADVRMARLRLVPAAHRPAARLNRFEQGVLAKLAPDDWRERSAVSASKFVRLEPPAGNESRARWDLLGSTVAPFVTGYALWLIEQARLGGIRALFFMARDMQIVCEVAAALVRAKGLALECVYIHASRAAWQPAAYTGDTDFDLFWLTDQPDSSDPLEALGRLLDEFAIAALQAAGLLRREPAESRRQTVARWLKEPAVAEAVAQEVARRRGLLVGYLGQRGYTPDGRSALVDAGWRGSLQKCLARAYGASGIRPVIPAFYIGLRHRVSLEDGCSMHSYLPDGEVERLGYSLVSLVEGFLTANHGTTLGYHATPEGGLDATLAGSPPAEIACQWAEVRGACVAHAGELAGLPALNADTPQVSRALAEPLLMLCGDPAPQEAAALRSWLFDAGRATPLRKPLVARLSATDFAKLLLARLRRTAEADVYLSGPWLRGSLALASPLARGLAHWLLSAARVKQSGVR